MLLFPEASDKTFADGYAQAVTFGLLMARAKNIRLADGFDKVGRELARNKMGEANCLASSGSESSPGVLHHM